MTLTEKTAYIKGLMEGLDFKADTPEKKILNAVVDLLDDLAIAVTEAEEDIEYLNDYAEELDADLGDVESDIYECDDDEDFDDEDEDDDEDYYEAVCPKCGEMIYLDDDLLECDDIADMLDSGFAHAVFPEKSTGFILIRICFRRQLAVIHIVQQCSKLHDFYIRAFSFGDSGCRFIDAVCMKIIVPAVVILKNVLHIFERIKDDR